MRKVVKEEGDDKKRSKQEKRMVTIIKEGKFDKKISNFFRNRMRSKQNQQ